MSWEWLVSYFRPVKRLLLPLTSRLKSSSFTMIMCYKRRRSSSSSSMTNVNLSKNDGSRDIGSIVSSTSSIIPKVKRIKDINVRYKGDKRLACCSVPYRINHYTKQCEFLLVKNGSHWTFPGGGWEHHESQEECVLRESWEESGIKPQIKNNKYDIMLLNTEPIKLHSATRNTSNFAKLLWIYAFHVDLDANHFPENRDKQWVSWEEVPTQLAPKEKENRVWELASKYFSRKYKLDQK